MLSIQGSALDVYLELPRDFTAVPETLLEHFKDAPKDPREEELVIMESRLARQTLLARDPMELVRSIMPTSDGGNAFERALWNVSCPAVTLRILQSDQWPFPVAHFSFIVEIGPERPHARQAVRALVLAGAQDLFHAVIEFVPEDLSRPGSAAVFSILANADRDFFHQIRATWSRATEPGMDHTDGGASGALWDVLPDEWRFGEPWGASHMARGLNVHGIIGTLHGTSHPVRQAYSLTIQDEELKSYGSGSLMRHGLGGDWLDEALLSPRREAYYDLRSQELGMLMLLDQWTSGLSERIRSLQRETFARVARNQTPGRLPPWRVAWPQAGSRGLMRLRIRAMQERDGLQRALTGATAQLRSVVGGSSIFSGLEVPVYLRPPLEHGRQRMAQEGLVLQLAERISLRLDSLTDATATVASVLAEEISLRVSLSQARSAHATTALTVAIAFLTAFIAYLYFVELSG